MHKLVEYSGRTGLQGAEGVSRESFTSSGAIAIQSVHEYFIKAKLGLDKSGSAREDATARGDTSRPAA